MRRKHFKTTLVITTYNWPKALEQSVRSALAQTVLPDEIIIADDGSGEETRLLVERLREDSHVPMVHLWQEDDGFRLATIRNKAIAAAKGDYIIQVDGDVIMPVHFVSDHLELAERGCFVCGSRVKLNPATSEKLLAGGIYRLRVWDMPPSFMLNSLRSRLLRKFMATRYGRKIDHLRGCNMAYWKADMIAVNGYNEALTSWGHEDAELAYRLTNAGVRKKALKMGGCVYHLYHKEASRDNEHTHFEAIERVKSERLQRCDDGISKYL
ncbi:MAG: glycosyltransferase family 2 protein [Prevotella sp.]|nr:glycosyltransferase family 2 protein [Prevotella sp.]